MNVRFQKERELPDGSDGREEEYNHVTRYAGSPGAVRR